jgi:hypothetical protein
MRAGFASRDAISAESEKIASLGEKGNRYRCVVVPLDRVLLTNKRFGCEPRKMRANGMVKFLLFCILFVMCWPLALLALVLYPLVWLLLLPFRVVGIAVGGVLELVSAIITLPARVIRAV